METTNDFTDATRQDGGAGNGVESDPGGLDRLREILVGGRLRDQERRYARLEERLAAELASLRTEIAARVEQLERHLKAESEASASRHGSEQQSRQSAEARLETMLHALEGALASEMTRVREAVARGEREQREAMLDDSARATDELHRVRDELSARMTREAGTLDHMKVDRSLLASMLGELASRVSGRGEEAGGAQGLGVLAGARSSGEGGAAARATGDGDTSAHGDGGSTSATIVCHANEEASSSPPASGSVGGHTEERMPPTRPVHNPRRGGRDDGPRMSP